MHFLSVSTAWGSKHGGVNVFNYRMCCALVRLGHTVTAFVKERTEGDADDARSKGVHLKFTTDERPGKWAKEDIGFVKYSELIDVDVVIIHDIVSKIFLDHLPKTTRQPRIVSFIHTLYRESEYFGSLSDDERTARTDSQLELIAASDLAFTSGKWLADQLKREYHGLGVKIKSFTPGREEIAPAFLDRTGSITVFGRLSLGNDQKQATAVLSAYKALSAEFQGGDFEGKPLPELRLLGLNLSARAQGEIKKNVFNEGALAARINFLDFDPYFDFHTSRTAGIIRTSRVILTPSIVETFGLASLEAACLGVPLITGKNSGFYHEIRRIIPKPPTREIEWLEVADFKEQELANHLRIRMRDVLSKYDAYKAGATIIAEAIATQWPTWDTSCRDMCAELNTLKARPAIVQPGKSNAFSVLDKLKSSPTPTSAETDQAATSFDKHADTVQLQTDRAPLKQLMHLSYGRQTLLHPLLIANYERSFADKSCTLLQQQLALFLSNDSLHSFRDILLCGGTSSGKTTAAELLFGLSNDDDLTSARIIYLAPTRALAQERWRAWSETFRAFKIDRYSENVILSTGEDHSSDRALIRGEFFIACLVFEKANVVLSASPELLKRITMVVIDELHMVSDIHRGPIIESLIAKMKYEKRRRQKRDGFRIPLRLVGVTTELAAVEKFKKYLQNYDWDKDVTIEPLLATDIGRPKPVKHYIVEPESVGTCSYRMTLIAQFSANEPLHLTEAELLEFENRVSQKQAEIPQKIYQGERGAKLKLIDKQLHFMKDWISNHPLGKRLLVFIGSKADQLELANRLQSEIKKNATLASRDYHLERLTSVIEEAKNDDTSVAIDVLNRSLGRGVFVHNADISRGLRFAIEEYLAKPLPAACASEVIIATETLSYGVNLALDDVAILSLEFPASERNQEFGASPTLLSRCAFFNMCGRAGRLNQEGTGTAAVYVWPITSQSTAARRLVAHFYCADSEDQMGSKIVHGEDKEAYERIIKSKRIDQAPLLFSYPFTKTVLDGLRFTGGAPGLNGATRRNDATLEELEDEFTGELLYSHEHGDNVRDTERLRASVKLIIDASQAPSFELVQQNGRGFKITNLGSSIIDTGTEITTLEPLKKALQTMLAQWRPAEDDGTPPVETLLLPIIVQNEAHRQVIGGMSEIRGDASIGENRESMLKWIVANFSAIGFTEAVTQKISVFLRECDDDPRGAPVPDATAVEVHDACLRLFCGLLMWVTGQPISQIQETLKNLGVIAGRRTDIATNFATLADRISWKLSFVTNLMRFSKATGDTRILQTKARRLTTRLRLGCAENALPLLDKAGNQKALVSRKLAHALLQRGATPKSISSGEFDLDPYTIEQRSAIRRQVRDYMRESFHSLKSEFVYSSAIGGNDESCLEYWEYADSVIKKYSENNLDIPEWPQSDGGEVQFTFGGAPGAVGADVPKIMIREEVGALLIIGSKVHWEDDERIPINAIKWHIQPSHQDYELRPTPEGFTAVLVDFPWLLTSQSNQQHPLRMSPAAFGILLTLITRSFLRDSVAALQILTDQGRPINSFGLVDLLYSELMLAQFPDAMFDAWAGYWDAE